MKKYSSYQDTDVDWIGEIPSHWERKRLKHITDSVNGYSFKSDDFDKENEIPVIRIGDVGDEINFTKCVKVKPKFLQEKSDFIIKKGDILIGLTGGTIGKSGRYDYDFPSLLNQRVGLLREQDSVQNKLLYYYVKSEVFIRYIFFNCYGGGQDNISMGDILNMLFPYPPIPEQRKIVSFLDEKTSKIDRLIQSKQRKIELLKEKRTSLINEVVTKGLNPDVDIEDSGIEWIGGIPRHWKLPTLNKISNITRLAGAEYTSYWEEDKNGEIQVLRGQNIGFGKIIHKNISRISNELSMKLIRSRLFKGDIVFPCVGTIGNSVVIEEDDKYHINQNISKITPDDGVYSYFLNYFLLSHTTKFQIIYHNTSEVQPSVLVSNLRRFYVCLPPFQEQKEIVEYLDSETQTIDQTISLEEQKIDLLKEYKQSLISEVVTGKVNVQEKVEKVLL